jgi:sporulation protein YlmC with PRC-barrel domain
MKGTVVTVAALLSISCPVLAEGTAGDLLVERHLKEQLPAKNQTGPGGWLPAPDAGTHPGQAADMRHADAVAGKVEQSGGGVPGKGNVDDERLHDYRVVLSDGKELGDVDRLVIDVNTGRVAYIEVLNDDTLLDMGAQRFDVPWSKVRHVDPVSQRIELGLTRDQVVKASDLSNRPAR